MVLCFFVFYFLHTGPYPPASRWLWKSRHVHKWKRLTFKSWHANLMLLKPFRHTSLITAIRAALSILKELDSECWPNQKHETPVFFYEVGCYSKQDKPPIYRASSTISSQSFIIHGNFQWIDVGSPLMQLWWTGPLTKKARPFYVLLISGCLWRVCVGRACHSGQHSIFPHYLSFLLTLSQYLTHSRWLNTQNLCYSLWSFKNDRILKVTMKSELKKITLVMNN